MSADRRSQRLRRQPQSPSQRVQLLLERRRTGNLPASRLRLAARLGDPAARRALGDEAPELRAPAADQAEAVEDWARQMTGTDRKIGGRVVTSAVQVARRADGHEQAEGPGAEALTAVARWLGDPGEDVRLLAVAEGFELYEWIAPALEIDDEWQGEFWLRFFPPDHPLLLPTCCAMAALSLARPAELPRALRAVGAGPGLVGLTVRLASHISGDPQLVYETTRDAVITWALA